MRILITNDDGLWAEGLTVLEEIAATLAGPEGEVWTIAPAFEQSGVGHCISYTKPMMISHFGPRRYAVDGSPADCVLAALGDVMQAAKPDLILSGVNRGNNAAENTLYSGTIGAIIEAALHGVRGVALSQFLGPRTAALADPFDAARRHAVGVVQNLLAHDDWGAAPYGVFYNVNFPPCAADDVQGVRVAHQGFRGYDGFGVRPQVAPNGRRFLWIKGADQHRDGGEGADASWNMRDYITVTPMRADLTAHDALAASRAAMNQDF